MGRKPNPEGAQDKRLRIAELGEDRNDLLKVDAALNRLSVSEQARSILNYRLQQREPIVKARVAYLAAKRQIDPQELWVTILKTGEIPDLTNEELSDLKRLDPEIWQI